MEINYLSQGGRQFHFMVDGNVYYVKDRFVLGEDIRKIANVPESYDLFLISKGNNQKKLIDNDESIDLAMPGIEKFETGKKSCIIIYINSKPFTYNQDKISFDKVIEMALGGQSSGKGYIVDYFDGPSQNEEGILSRGAEVFVKNNMHFNVSSAHVS